MRSCNSRVTVSIRLTVLLNAKSPLVLANDSRRLRANTISLTKFMSLSSNSTLTLTGAANSLELSASLTAASIATSLTTSKTSCSRLAISASNIFSAIACGADSITTSTAGETGAAEGAETVLVTPVPPSVKNLRFWINAESSPSGSRRCFCTPSTIARKRSDVSKRTSVISSFSVNAPSRNLLKRDSPACATFSRR